MSRLKKGFSSKWDMLNKKLAFPCDYFRSFNDYDLPITNLVKEDCFRRLKNGYPENSEIQRTNNITESLYIEKKERINRVVFKK